MPGECWRFGSDGLVFFMQFLEVKEIDCTNKNQRFRQSIALRLKETHISLQTQASCQPGLYINTLFI